jgi:hypothetical protein
MPPIRPESRTVAGICLRHEIGNLVQIACSEFMGDALEVPG